MSRTATSATAHIIMASTVSIWANRHSLKIHERNPSIRDSSLPLRKGECHGHQQLAQF
jgi:hypothetical protein